MILLDDHCAIFAQELPLSNVYQT